MRRHLSALVLLGVILLGCGRPASPISSVSTPTAAIASTLPPATSIGDHAAGRCRSSDLQLSLGDRFSERTGQHTLLLTLTNRSQSSCQLFGYPKVTLIDTSDRDLPFDFRTSGDQVVTSSPPIPVILSPGASGFVTLNKYRCDLGDRGTARTVRLIPPDDTVPLSLPLAENRPSLAYCGPGDPGSTVFISPIEATLRATLAH